jgi:hypothetical protein
MVSHRENSRRESIGDAAEESGAGGGGIASGMCENLISGATGGVAYSASARGISALAAGG